MILWNLSKKVDKDKPIKERYQDLRDEIEEFLDDLYTRDKPMYRSAVKILGTNKRRE